MLLVCDALNYLSRFVPCDEAMFENATASELFAEAHARVVEFAEALKAARVDVVFVFDNGQATEESNSKWIDRRRKEVESGRRTLPAGSETVLRATLEGEGFKVFFPANIDGDDAVARLAMKLDAHVLSRDQDMMRYGLSRGRVLSDFAIRNGKISFLTRDNQTKASRRDISSIECDDLSKWESQGSTLRINAMQKELRRGNADGRTRTLGNLHAIVRPLRAALYARLGTSTVTETLPTWQDGAFKLVTSDVTPDNTLNALLDNPLAMFQWIRKTDCGGEAFEDRKHGAAMLAAELHDATCQDHGGLSSARHITSIYQALLPISTVPDKAKLGWASGGRCTGLRNKGRLQPCLGDGLCFPMQIESAAYHSKDPLCSKCLVKLFEIIEMSKLRRQVQGAAVH
jgi:hypothetical protein